MGNYVWQTCGFTTPNGVLTQKYAQVCHEIHTHLAKGIHKNRPQRLLGVLIEYWIVSEVKWVGLRLDNNGYLL